MISYLIRLVIGAITVFWVWFGYISVQSMVARQAMVVDAAQQWCKRTAQCLGVERGGSFSKPELVVNIKAGSGLNPAAVQGMLRSAKVLTIRAPDKRFPDGPDFLIVTKESILVRGLK